MKRIKLEWIYKAMLLCVGDSLIILVSYFVALFLRFDFRIAEIPKEYMAGYLWSMPFWVVATIVIFYVFKLYHSIWVFVSIAELKRIVLAELVLIPVYIAGALFMDLHMPKSYYIMGYVLSAVLCAGIRFSYRYLRFYTTNLKRDLKGHESSRKEERIMIIKIKKAKRMLQKKR